MPLLDMINHFNPAALDFSDKVSFSVENAM
jgi:hypothetical protein